MVAAVMATVKIGQNTENGITRKAGRSPVNPRLPLNGARAHHRLALFELAPPLP